MMKVGDLVTWNEKTEVVLPWYYDNWKDIGIVLKKLDDSAVIVRWSSGEEFSVFIHELKIISEDKE
tara:strand:+ start:727 stop:924 length:198 start_codon:yes stop_codon:yes gene_type:complete